MGVQRRFFRTHFPERFQSWTNNGRYSTIDSFALEEDNYYYAARIRQAATHAVPGDPYIRGHRSTRLALTDAITYEAFALIWRIVGDARRAWPSAQFVFVLLWVPCLYFILLELGCARAPAVWLAVLSTLYADLARVLLIFLDFNPLQTLRAALQYSFWFLGSYHYFFGPTRPTGPLFTYPCLFLASLLFVRADGKQDRASLILAGAAGGLLAYVHSDVVSTFFGAAFIYCVWRASKRAAAMLLVAFFVALPWVVYCRPAAEQIPLYGMRPGRLFFPGALVFLAGAALSWRFLRDRPMGVWCGSLLAAMFLACNAPLVSGFYLLQGHYFYIGNTFLVLVLGAWLLPKVRGLEESDWRWLTLLTLLVCLPRLVSYSALHYQIQALPAEEERAYAWLDKNTPEEAVVAALSPQTDLRLSVHTHDRIAVSFLFPIISDVPIAENAERLIFALSLYDARLEDYLAAGDDPSGRWADKLWQGQVDHLAKARDGMMWVHFCGMEREKIKTLLRATAEKPAKSFDVDYLWVGAFEEGLMGRRGVDPKLFEKVFENSAAAVYRRKG